MSQSLAAISSAFGDKLSSNYVPNDEEVAIIKDLLAEPDKELQAITGEIEEIKAQLEELLKEKEDLNEQLKAHKALLSPARRLPPDVVQKIFLHCLPTERNPVMSSKEAPVLLGRICSQWRDIALGTPELWAAIHIVVPSDPPVPMPLGPLGANPPPPPQSPDHTMRVQAVTAWLSRSGTCPLSISLYSSHFDSGVGNSVQSYLDAILTFSSRWKSIHMSLTHQHWSNFLPRVREADVPILEKVYLDSGIGYHGVPNSPGIGTGRDSGLLKAPTIHSVSLIQFVSHILHLPLRWSRLTKLNLSGSIPSWQPTEGLSISESISILFLCSNLEYFSVQLSLAGFTPLPNGDHGLPKVTMKKLLGLAVTETNNVDSAPFFEHIITPALRHLKFRRNTPNSYIAVPDLAQMGSLRAIHVTMSMFLRQVEGLLETFELDALYVTEVDVMKCLSLMPGLKKLSLWSYGSSAAPASPYATPVASPWETVLFTFEDTQLRRFISHTAGNDGLEPISINSLLDEETNSSLPLVALPPEAPPPLTLPSLADNCGSPAAADDAALENASSKVDNGSTVPSTTTSVPAPTLTPFSPVAKDKGKGRAEETKPAKVEEFSEILCPLLEEFHCSGAAFSDEVMLAFLRARSSLASQQDPSPPPLSTTSLSSILSPPPPSSSSSSLLPPSSSESHSSSAASFGGRPQQEFAHLRQCRISFTVGREESDEIKEKLEEIRKETGMNLEVNYPPAPLPLYKPYTPYAGLPSVPVLGVGPGFDTTGMTTVNVNGLSGEPVFLHSAAFY